MKTLMLCFLSIGLAGCVHISNPEMPSDWTALHPLSAPAELDGTYRGDYRQCSQFATIFFEDHYKWIQRVNGYRLAAHSGGLQVEALAGDVVLESRILEIRFADGAVTLERRTSGHEGLGAASYRDVSTLQLNTAGELVARYHSTSVGIVFPIPAGSSDTQWWRIQRASKGG